MKHIIVILMLLFVVGAVQAGDWCHDKPVPTQEPTPPPVSTPVATPEASNGPSAPGYLVAALDVGDPLWVCNGSIVRDADGNPVITPVEYMYWKPLNTNIPVTVLNLSSYIHPGDCTALHPDTLEPMEAWYMDYDRYTCVAGQNEDVNCPGVTDFH